MLCEVDQDEKSCIRDEPGLLLANSLLKLDDKCRCQLSIINSTTKTYTLKRGCVMGKMSIVEDIDVHTLAEVVKSTPHNLVAQQNDLNPNSSEPMESDGADPVEDSLESDPDDNLLLAELVRRNKRQRSGSSEEEEIPEFKLRKRLKRREERLAEMNAVVWV